MRLSIFRLLLAAVLGTAVLFCHAPAHAQFRGREIPPTNMDRIPEALEQLVQAIDEQSLAKPPQRDFKIERGPSREAKLFRADPKLLENKFFAAAILAVASKDVGGTRNRQVSPADLPSSEIVYALRELPQSVKRLVDGRNGVSTFTGVDPSLFGRSLFSGQPVNTSDAILTLSGYFKLLSELCPKEQLPPQAAIGFLTSADCDRDVQWSYGSRPPQGEGRELYIAVYAPTAELAEQRARAAVQLLDGGLCRPLQRDCLGEAKKSLEAARKGYADVARQSREIGAKEENLARPSEITAEILTELRAQKVMVGIELAGLNARVKACNEMLKAVSDDTRPPSQVHNSIADMKVRAEVDLVGTKEKLDRINALISEGNDRETLRSQIDRLKSERQELQRQIDRQHLRRAEAYARLVSLYAPLELKDNQITISPVEWTN